MEKEKKVIKLAIVIRDEEYFQHIVEILQNEKDINVLCAMNIKDLQTEVQPAIAFLEQMIKQQPEILILDQIILREVASLDLERILGYRRKLPNMRTIIVGKRYNEENVLVMMKGGAHGFFKPEQGDEQLIKCVRVVSEGQRWLDTELTNRVFDKISEESEESKESKNSLKALAHISREKLKGLTSREMEILSLVSESMTNEEIAEKLFLSAKTVKTHVRNIFEKTGIRNRVEAALTYTRYALLSHTT
ncbi:MAG TPA: response regulator transcription factor [Candidatus Moranbacteria bacterium]|nr:response regulator transcription factor [Candidatus Moranbacteria bacterium]HRY27880.1 response regulator transcription factor [Candidatus Moranbacteria bacterium]HSA08351.1 response regulator transcription factor [Candidatus Moranbacteria bacterium]